MAQNVREQCSSKWEDEWNDHECVFNWYHTEEHTCRCGETTKLDEDEWDERS